MTYYRGFSTVGNSKNFRLTDFELVKQDLLNRFNIRKGEKLMRPEEGTEIWDLLFEPLDNTTRDRITADVQRQVAADPRIGVKNLTVTEYESGIQMEIDLIYVEGNQRENLRIKFDRESRSLIR